MGRNSEVTALIDEINVETNNVAARIQTLLDWIETTEGEGLNAADTETLIGALAQLRDRQKALGANPNTPIPPPVEPLALVASKSPAKRALNPG